MAIEIRQLNIKSNVVQQAAVAGAASGKDSTGGSSGGEGGGGGGCQGAQIDEDTRSDMLAQCREMVLELLNRSRER